MLVMELFYILKSEESRGPELERNQRINAYNSRISFDFLYKPERLQIITSYIILSYNLSSWVMERIVTLLYRNAFGYRDFPLFSLY